MKWEFCAKDDIDAAGAVQNWIADGIMPDNCSYSISANPERSGYWVAEAVN